MKRQYTYTFIDEKRRIKMAFKFDVEALRNEFPACRLQINGTPIAYLDGPGGTQVPGV